MVRQLRPRYFARRARGAHGGLWALATPQRRLARGEVSGRWNVWFTSQKVVPQVMSVGLKSHENWFDISPTKSLLIGLISPPSYVCWFIGWFIGWFIIPLTIVINSNFTMYRLYNPINCRYITHKNHSYWSYLHQLNAIERGHHLVEPPLSI